MEIIVRKSKKLCFVIMGFGKKTDYSTGKTYDLDKTYKNIIQPAVLSENFDCVRADEIQDSGLIDKSMYALLMHADLVIADITTFNPNAIYELGIRHAVRPFSTIIIKEQDGKIPFDLDHTRVFHYKHLGEDIGLDEATRCQDVLKTKIKYAFKKHTVDSPLYDYLDNIDPPKIPESEYKKIIDELAARESHIYAIVEKAKDLMDKSDFSESIIYWEKATRIIPTEDYFIQQLALATYKSKIPSEFSALTDALGIIEKLAPEGESKDPETLGIIGAINKRMWLLNDDVEFLKRAEESYRQGFLISNDFYTGENYALCLNILGSKVKNEDEKIFYRISAIKVREKIIYLLSDIKNSIEEGFMNDNKWAYASLANCYFGLKDDENGNKMENAFKAVVIADWELSTYESSKIILLDLLGRS
jgi:tetratricopeptide (TPR) repeat protein